MTVGQTIYNQIGQRAFAMMGAKTVVTMPNGLHWKVGKNSKKVTHVMVTLDPSDTYTVGFYRQSRGDLKQLKNVEGVYVDMLHETIQNNTGLYLSL